MDWKFFIVLALFALAFVAISAVGLEPGHDVGNGLAEGFKGTIGVAFEGVSLPLPGGHTIGNG